MNRLRVLVFAPDANPDGVTGALIGYSQAQALAKLHEVTLVIRPSCEESVRRKPGAIQAIEVIRLGWLERIYDWIVHWVFRDNYYNYLLQALFYPLSVLLEWQAWRQTRDRIKAGRFDIVLRLLPAQTISPSPFSFFLKNGPIPLVIGPVNGGLPWPQGFRQAKAQNNKWVLGLRRLYPYLPFARSTYTHATAVVAGSSHTYSELSAQRAKLFFLPENGVDESLCSNTERRDAGGPLELIFIGGLIALKACDLGLQGAAPLIREHLARFTVVGDGPERKRLEELAKTLGIAEEVCFTGLLRHDAAMERLRSADVLVFPSVRDFGGGVVFEALSLGVVPVVADFGGPGDIVRPEVGFKVQLTNEADVVSQIEKILRDLEQDRARLDQLRRQAVSFTRENLTWDAKAQVLTSIMYWALRQGSKPDLPSPKVLNLEGAR